MHFLTYVHFLGLLHCLRGCMQKLGNSAAMIERHYSKLTATMAADKLA
jgi:hypothetical protein